MPGVHLPPAGPSAAHLEYKKVALPPELKSSAKASVASLTSLLIYIQILSATANKDPPDAPKQRTMAPHPTLNASSTVPPNLGPSHLPQPTAFQLGGFNQNQWGPDAIGTIFFGVVMFLIGVTALWQGRLRRLRHEEGTSIPLYK